MLQSEIEEHVNQWPQMQERVYKYRWGFNIPHIITLAREEDLFLCVESKSTYKDYPTLNIERLIKEIGSGRLIYLGLWEWKFDHHHERTDGCECGAVFTTEPDCHASWCPRGRYRGPF